MLRKEGGLYVLDLFVRVPPSVTAPFMYTPMEVAGGRERGRRVMFDCNTSTFRRQE